MKLNLLFILIFFMFIKIPIGLAETELTGPPTYTKDASKTLLREEEHELGLSFRIKGFKTTPAFYVQHYHGYSESLEFYKKEESVVRFGFVL